MEYQMDQQFTIVANDFCCKIYVSGGDILHFQQIFCVPYSKLQINLKNRI